MVGGASFRVMQTGRLQRLGLHVAGWAKLFGPTATAVGLYITAVTSQTWKAFEFVRAPIADAPVERALWAITVVFLCSLVWKLASTPERNLASRALVNAESRRVVQHLSGISLSFARPRAHAHALLKTIAMRLDLGLTEPEIVREIACWELANFDGPSARTAAEQFIRACEFHKLIEGRHDVIGFEWVPTAYRTGPDGNLVPVRSEEEPGHEEEVFGEMRYFLTTLGREISMEP